MEGTNVLSLKKAQADKDLKDHFEKYPKLLKRYLDLYTQIAQRASFVKTKLTFVSNQQVEVDVYSFDGPYILGAVNGNKDAVISISLLNLKDISFKGEKHEDLINSFFN